MNIDTAAVLKYTDGLPKNLIKAVSHGQVENIRKVLDNRQLSADHLIICRLLHYVAACGLVEVVSLLINEYNCPVDCRNDNRQTPLHIACIEGHLSVVRVLASEHKADLNACDKDNNTPLNLAALSGHTNIVTCLIDEFSNYSSLYNKGFRGGIAIHHACYSGNGELVEMLLTKYNLDPFSVNRYGNTPLHIAALVGREEVANMLITKYQCSVDCRNDRRQTPLHVACTTDSLNVVRMLVSKHRANLNAIDKDGNSPLNVAAWSGHTRAVMCLIDEFSCNLDVKGFKGSTIIHQACDSGSIELVEMLLTKYNLDPLSVDDNGNTPLHISASAGREEVANMLITKYNCPVDCKNNKEQTPLHFACSKGHLSVVMKFVSQHKANINVCDEYRDTPLNKAALNRHTNVVQTLIDKFNCSPNIKGFDGRTVIHQACDSGDIELVEILFTDYHMNPMSIDDNGDTPLHIAASANRQEVADMLITKHKCPVECRNNRKQTPLHIACYKGNIGIIRMLLNEYKADLCARDQQNNTPLNHAALGGHTDIVRSLIDEFSCSPKTKGYEGRSLLHQACICDHEELVKFLIDTYKLSVLSTDNSGHTPLHISAMFGSSKCLYTLLYSYNAPVFLRNKFEKTAIDFVIHESNKCLMTKYLQNEHNRIEYEYTEMQRLSLKTYYGAQNLTRIFVVGNVGSGKSTLIESLQREGLFSSLSSVSEATVPPHTSGIIPSVHYSKTIGRVLYYDFAGDPEYYSSHSAIVSNVLQSKCGTNIFLVVVNFAKDIQSILNEIGYWLNFVLYNIKNRSKKSNILLIGSHADCISRSVTKSKLISISQFLLEYTFCVSQMDLEVIDILIFNCCKPRSSKQVLKTVEKTVNEAPAFLLSGEAAILLGLLEKDFNDVVTCRLQTLLSHIKDTSICLPNTATSLYPFVEELHAVGLLMIVKREGEKLENCLLLLDISKLTNEVHKLLFSGSSTQEHGDNSHGASMGILPHSYLKKILPEYISTDCLVQLQYCQEFGHAEVKFDHLVVPTEHPSAPKLLHFPALCTAERKNSIITPDDYTYSIGWFAECHGKFDYFPSRYLHVLLLRLAFSFAHPVAPCAAEGESEHVVDVMKSNCRCTMWKNGIHWLMEEGVECIVELINNNKGVVVITKSRVEEERKYKCAEMLFKVINLAVQAKEEFCHSITLKQYLMPLDPKDTSSFKERDNLFDLRDVDHVLKERKPVALSITGKKKEESSNLAHLKVHLLTGSKLCKQSNHPQVGRAKTKDIDNSVLHDIDHPSLYEKLKEHSYKWKEIGTLLGFCPGELDNIEARPLLLSGAPKSWLSSMLAEWLEWAPGDARGSKDFATLDGLRQAVDKAGLSATSLTL